HRLPPGKQTPFEEDIHVPLTVRGPGVAKDKTVSSFAREIDLAPTFADLAHARPASFVDGVSLVPELTGQSTDITPQDVLIEHYAGTGTRAQRRASEGVDPDNDANPPRAAGAKKAKRAIRLQLGVAIPTYRALRTDRYLYAEYSTGEKQLYDIPKDPNELHS